MPELPEVTTTAKKLNEILPNLKIVSVWTSYNSPYFKGKTNIKDPIYFRKFKKEIVGRKIDSVERRGKNILINIDGPKTILIHLKMTGHLLYGKYKKGKVNENVNGSRKTVPGWKPTEDGPLQDKFNGYIRLVFELSNGNFLALSDVRKFAKIYLIDDGNISTNKDLMELGPDPTDRKFDFKKFSDILSKRPSVNIKNVLMDQSLISGIGNIYSDEALWMSGIHPEEQPQQLSQMQIKKLLKNIKEILKKGIDLGGDSTSDYRQPDGTRGNFQKHHKVYRRKGEKCFKKGCNGQIVRKVVGGRSAHFCNRHQKLIDKNRQKRN